MSQIEKNDTFMPLGNIEFFAYEHEIWYRQQDGTTAQLKESDDDLVGRLTSALEEFYPKAFDALCKKYSSCSRNLPYYRYRIVARFIRCNFSALDNIPDVIRNMFSGFEYVPCPLRGECPYECVICRPEFNHKLSSSEMRVMELWFSGYSEDDIASALCLSQHTIHNHIRNSYMKLGVHTKAEFVRYADDNNLFK